MNCSHLKKDNTPCSRKAKTNSKYCWQHNVKTTDKIQKFLEEKKSFENSNTVTNNNVIKFFLPKDSYFFLSNYSDSEFTINQIKYITNEHFYQSSKFDITDCKNYTSEQIKRYDEYKILIIDQPTAHQAKCLASQNPKGFRISPTVIQLILQYPDVKIREDWDKVKEDVMYQGLIAKFTQNQKLREKLLETGNNELIENSPFDSVWGCGMDGKGENKLGKMLMKVRNELKNNTL